MAKPTQSKSFSFGPAQAQFYSLLAVAIFGLIIIGIEVLTGEINLVIVALAGVVVAISGLAASFKIVSTPTKRVFGSSKSKLEELALKSATIINSIAEGVVSIDEQGKIELINPEAQRLIGWNEDEAVGIDYPTVLQVVNNAGKPIDHELDPIRKALTTSGAAMSRSASLKTFSGKIIPVTLLATPVKDETKSTIVTFRNISREIKEEREQREFISTASHEMRTPVAAIDGYIGLALNPKTAAVDERAKEYLLKAQDSTKHLSELYSNLLNISKAEDGRLEMDLKVHDLVAVVGDICQVFQSQAAEKGLQLDFLPASGGGGVKKIAPVVYVHADRNLLVEAITNLVSNSIKYTEKGGVKVDVNVGDNDTALVTIADTGIGIPPEDIDHLFQKFYRVDNSQTRERNGTGLGLYLTRKIIENFHGQTWVTSKLGEGSTFFVSLPRLANDKATQMMRLEEQTVRGNQPLKDSKSNRPKKATVAKDLTSPMSNYAPATKTPTPASNYQTSQDRSLKPELKQQLAEMGLAETNQLTEADHSAEIVDLSEEIAEPDGKTKPKKLFSALLIPDDDARRVKKDPAITKNRQLDDDELLEAIAKSAPDKPKPKAETITNMEDIQSAWSQKKVTLDDIKNILNENSRFANKFRDKIEHDTKLKAEINQQTAGDDSESVVDKIQHHQPAGSPGSDQLTLDLIEKYKEAYLELLPHNVLKNKQKQQNDSKH